MIVHGKTNIQLLSMAWGITGGWRAASLSGDFWISLTVTVLCFNFWYSGVWWDQVISVLPNLLGFTLGGFAIFLGFGSESFKTMLSNEDELKSPYVSVSAAFLIFVAFQVLALLYALVAKGTHFDLSPIAAKFEISLAPWMLALEKLILKIEPFSSAVGYFLFVYSLVFALRASMRIFRLSRWYHHLIVLEEKEAEQRRRDALNQAAPTP